MDTNPPDVPLERPSWLAAFEKADGPLYLAIADAIAAAVATGELQENTRLPPQRVLAKQLGIDFTTVTRAYSEAQRRGIVSGKVGQGTFVRHAPVSVPNLPANAPVSGVVDLSPTCPPAFDDPTLSTRLWRGIAALEEADGLDLLLRYQPAGGTARDRAAGQAWLSRRLPGLAAERVLIAPGAQGAMLAIVSALATAGDTVLTEALTDSGFRMLSGHLRLRLRGLAQDSEGLDPDAFDAACREGTPKLLYCAPTLHNPTTVTMTVARREALVAVARKHGVPIIEDDSYGMLPVNAPPPLATLAPEMTYCLGGLARGLSPALRVTYLAVPDARSAGRVAGAIRATATMSSPLTSAIATHWIEDGTIDRLLSAVREETRARNAMVAHLLPAETLSMAPEAPHVWLTLPTPWTRAEFTSRLSAAGVAVAASDVFAVGQPPEAFRIGLGGPPTRATLADALHKVADLLDQYPDLPATTT